MCLHLGDWSPGYRSWGDDIPGFAQGCYFPGDEPGYLCTITGEVCDPDNCPKKSQGEPSWR